jgi:hypothetical protein
MEKCLENKQLILINTGEYTRHNAPHNYLSAIDLTITNSSFAPKTQWNILNEYSSSDHRANFYKNHRSNSPNIPNCPLEFEKSQLGTLPRHHKSST